MISINVFYNIKNNKAKREMLSDVFSCHTYYSKTETLGCDILLMLI